MRSYPYPSAARCRYQLTWVDVPCNRHHMAKFANEGARRMALVVQACGSQAELARRCGLSPEHVSRYLAGTRRPGLEAALRIQTAVGIPIGTWVQSPADVAA